MAFKKLMVGGAGVCFQKRAYALWMRMFEAVYGLIVVSYDANRCLAS